MSAKQQTVDYAKMTKEQLAEQLALIHKAMPELKKNKKQKRVVKLNKSGRLYVTDPCMQDWSENKNKFYTAGVNFNFSPECALALFKNQDLINEIIAYLEQFQFDAKGAVEILGGETMEISEEIVESSNSIAPAQV